MTLPKMLKRVGVLAATVSVASVDAAHDTLVGADSSAFVQLTWFFFLYTAAIFILLYILTIIGGTLRQLEPEAGVPATMPMKWSANIWLTVFEGIITSIGWFAFAIGLVFLLVIRNDTTGHTPAGSDTESAINRVFVSALIYGIFYPIFVLLMNVFFLRGGSGIAYGIVTFLHWIPLVLAAIFGIGVDAWVAGLLFVAAFFLALNGGVLLIARSSNWFSDALSAKSTLPPIISEAQQAQLQQMQTFMGLPPSAAGMGGFLDNPQFPQHTKVC